MKRAIAPIAWAILLQSSASALALARGPTDEPAGDAPTDPPQQIGGAPAAGGRVFKDRLTPHWFDGDARFWYRNDLAGGAKEFLLVDADRGTRGPAFDHARLAAALTRAAGVAHGADRLPFDDVAFADGGRSIRFRAGDQAWRCDLDSYECTRAEAVAPPAAGAEPGPPGRPSRRRGRGDGDDPDRDRPRSPDAKWVAFVRDRNVFARAEADGTEVQLSDDGKEGREYGQLAWSPDSKALVGWRIEPAERKEVHLIQSSPPGGGRARLRSRPYPLPGDPFAAYELVLFDVAAGKATRPDLERVDFGEPRPRWRPDGRHFTYARMDRGHQRFRLVEVDAQTGTSRNLIDERADTFLWSAHTENLALDTLNWLDRTDEILYVSERDGWRHLYLIDAARGEVRNQVTRGEYVLRGIDRIDEERRQVWFRASGREPGQDPYFLHAYRVDFDGTGLVRLTEGDGSHAVQYSPTRKYLIDTSSRVDLAPAHTLRRGSDGGLVCRLEEADIAALRAGGWQPPEVFVAKGRDGTTDIWGIICRPKDFDPARRYPVVESIYAGPQGSFVPKTFSPARRFAALADLGFIVVQVDGMGTANRSKAFHDVCWRNLKDAGFPDRILWHRAAARAHPEFDLSRVGIYGTSAGGQNAAGGVLFHPDFYKVAVAACGCHDNRMDKASWNEQWMGYPVGPQYAESSNIDNAHRLRGKLLLIVGELDSNVPPESTYRFCDALIRADKDFDFLLVPNANHGNGGAYGQRKTNDFFVRHLLGGVGAAPRPDPAIRAVPTGEAP